MENLIKVMESSVLKHGSETPVTLGHLLNIIKLVSKLDNYDELRCYHHDEEAVSITRDTYGS